MCLHVVIVVVGVYESWLVEIVTALEAVLVLEWLLLRFCE